MIYHVTPGSEPAKKAVNNPAIENRKIPTMPASILIADDYDDNRELLRLMLETEGYSIREARNGREALDAAREEAPALALIDLSMPSLDGWALLRELRSDERTRSIPCIAVTAFAADQDRRRVLDAGFDAYISKPFRSRELIETVKGFVRKDGSHGGGQGQP
ncbi:MAG TPA: response regulator [Pyrinomonadaceae bacterium]|nr:response regulator [Pyrinomonadaceae bacterium]